MIKLLCRVMIVSESGFYTWRKRLTKPPKLKRQSTAQLVKNSYLENRRRYGSRRIVAELQRRGEKLGRYKVRRLMREQGLQAIRPKRFVPQTTDSSHTKAAVANLLKQVTAAAPLAVGTIIIGDITYLPLASGEWCYLAMWQDKATRRIVGWQVGETMTTGLVIKALQQAIKNELLTAGAIIHTDRGSQYAASEFRALLERHRLRQSMSARGNCYDNAQAESWFSRFKSELVEGGVFEDCEQARSEVFSYIEGYYNRTRLHSGLGYKTPLEYEAELREKEKDKESEEQGRV